MFNEKNILKNLNNKQEKTKRKKKNKRKSRRKENQKKKKKNEVNKNETTGCFFSGLFLLFCRGNNRKKHEINRLFIILYELNE